MRVDRKIPLCGTNKGILIHMQFIYLPSVMKMPKQASGILMYFFWFRYCTLTIIFSWREEQEPYMGKMEIQHLLFHKLLDFSHDASQLPLLKQANTQIV